MPVRRTRRLRKADRDRALALLASCRDGCPEALMVAHGFVMRGLERRNALSINKEKSPAGARGQ